MFVDSHCHLNYLPEPDMALRRARARGVTECLCIGVNQKEIGEVLQIAQAQTGVWASVGEHPMSCSGDASWVEAYLAERDVVAVGEMGLDYHYVEAADQQAHQRHTFAQQLNMACEAALPVIIHTRAAEADTLALIADQPQVKGVLHCFTESWGMAEQALAQGYYISISGIVTFKNATQVQDVARRVPADRLLIETDAPWLAPVPHRGEKNEPSFVADTAHYVAQLRNIPVEELAQTTRDNFFRLFNRAG